MQGGITSVWVPVRWLMAQRSMQYMILPFAPFSNNYFAKLVQPAWGEAAQLLQAEDTYMAAIVTSLVNDSSCSSGYSCSIASNDGCRKLTRPTRNSKTDREDARVHNRAAAST